MGNVKTENTVKRLEQDKAKTKDPLMKEAIQNKINLLKSGKAIIK